MESRQHFEISQQEICTRRWWLLSTIVLYFLLPFFCLGSFFTATIVGVPRNILVVLLTRIIAIYIVFFIPSFAIMYHCVYRKFGNAWLICGIIVASISITVQLFDFLKYRPSVVTGAFVVINLWWVLLSLKLRRVNKRIRRKIFASEVGSAVTERILNASTVEELHLIVREYFDKWPQHKVIISDLYKEKRKILANSL